MMVQLTARPPVFGQHRPQTGLQKLAGNAPNQTLQKIVQQINANFADKENRDIAELSQKAKDLVSASKAKKADDTKKPEAPTGYQKYPAGMFTAQEWAENALSAQRDGIQTASDAIDYAKSKLKFTMGKMDELENYLNGTGTHSDPNMTRELAETYLHNYRQSLQQDFKDFLQSHANAGMNTMFSKEYDDLSGGLASQVIENQLDSINADSLGLSNLSGDPKEMLEALENASKILAGMNQKVEAAYGELTGGKTFIDPPRSSSIFGADSSLHFAASQMERPQQLMHTANMKLTGKFLDLHA